jgi:hypothetical protein
MVPNRFPEVRAICERWPASFPQDEHNDAARLQLLQTVIIPTLNQIDDGDWGYLRKTDQHDKVPCDVIVWRPTMAVIDCLTGSGACWIVHAPPPPEWVWTAVETAPPPDPPPADASVPVCFGTLTGIGTLVPQAGEFVVLFNASGEVASLQPDGRLEWRAPGTVGAWELARRIGPNLLQYEGTGSVYYVAVQTR